MKIKMKFRDENMKTHFCANLFLILLKGREKTQLKKKAHQNKA